MRIGNRLVYRRKMGSQAFFHFEYVLKHGVLVASAGFWVCILGYGQAWGEEAARNGFPGYRA